MGRDEYASRADSGPRQHQLLAEHVDGYSATRRRVRPGHLEPADSDGALHRVFRRRGARAGIGDILTMAAGIRRGCGRRRRPGSREVFKPYKHADKFRPLPELWREGDDAVWLVPSRSRSLARVVTARDLPLRVPVNGIDYDSIRPYVNALNDASLPVADFRWTSRHHAAITAVLRPEHAVSLQITHHPGWHARVNGSDRPIKKDGLRTDVPRAVVPGAVQHPD